MRLRTDPHQQLKLLFFFIYFYLIDDTTTAEFRKSVLVGKEKYFFIFFLILQGGLLEIQKITKYFIFLGIVCNFDLCSLIYFFHNRHRYRNPPHCARRTLRPRTRQKGFSRDGNGGIYFRSNILHFRRGIFTQQRKLNSINKNKNKNQI